MKIDARVTPIGNETSDSKLKGLASITINNEIAISGLRIFDSDKGLFVQMPQTRIADGEYKDIVFPITAEARTEIQDVVLERYKNPISMNEIQLIGAYETKNDIAGDERITTFDENTQSYIEKPDITMGEFRESIIAAHDYVAKNKIEPAEKTKLSVSLRTTNGEFTKAAGQVVLDNAVVVTGIKVIESTKGTFVQMPSYQNQYGEYKDFAYPVTAEMHERLKKTVLTAYQNIGKYEHKGISLAELGEKENIQHYNNLNNAYAEKLMSELENREIAYSARIEKSTTISINVTDKTAFDIAQKELKETLKPAEPKKTR